MSSPRLRSRLVALSVATILVSPAAEAPGNTSTCPLDTTRALAYVAEARASHEAWLRYLRSGRASEAERAVAGDEAWQASWIERYLFTERVLRERCRMAF